MGNYYSGVMNSDYDSELKHFGILGQKWGIRRFQNEDGTLTPAGRERYGKSEKEWKKIRNKGMSDYHVIMITAKYMANGTLDKYDESKISDEFIEKAKDIFGEVSKQTNEMLVERAENFENARAEYQKASDPKESKKKKKIALDAFKEYSEGVKDRGAMLSYYLENEIKKLPKDEQDNARYFAAANISNNLNKWSYNHD